MAVVLTGAVEGLFDEAVAKRLVGEVGGQLGDVYGKNGKTPLLKRLDGYNAAAKHAPWVVLVDLDRDADCAPPARARWLPEPAPLMCFRIAVRAVETWLLADRERFARFLGVKVASLPRSPEDVEDPKQLVVDLARTSRKRDVRVDLVPRRGSGRRVGGAYVDRLTEFVLGSWQPQAAAENADSLRRCLQCLAELVEPCP
jgi:hypothetical protein